MHRSWRVLHRTLTADDVPCRLLQEETVGCTNLGTLERDLFLLAVGAAAAVVWE